MSMPEFEVLRVLCAELEAKATEFGGLPHSAEQNDWGIEPYEVDGEPGQFVLRDCDGERWAAGTALEIMAKRDRLIRQVEDAVPFNESEEE